MKSPGRILLVDDEPLVLEMFEQFLEHHGYTVTSASSSLLARQQLSTNFFDLVLTDLRLDGFDGFQVIELARQINPQVGAIIVTGAPQDGDRERAKKLSAAYLSKPVMMDELLSSVKVLLNCSLQVRAQNES